MKKLAWWMLGLSLYFGIGRIAAEILVPFLNKPTDAVDIFMMSLMWPIVLSLVLVVGILRLAYLFPISTFLITFGSSGLYLYITYARGRYGKKR